MSVVDSGGGGRGDGGGGEKKSGGEGGDRRKGGEKAKAVKVTQDEQGNTVVTKVPVDGKTGAKVYGNPGTSWCMLCRARRDRLAVDCPGNVCNRCKLRGHWARSCPHHPCSWCGSLEHHSDDCPACSLHIGGNKRKLESSGESQPEAKASRGASGSYSGAVRSTPLPLAKKVDKFLHDVGDDSVMSEESISRRKADFQSRREAAKALYEKTLAEIDQEERELDEEVQGEQEYLEAIQRLAALRQRRHARRAGSSATAAHSAPEVLTFATREQKNGDSTAPAGAPASADVPASADAPLTGQSEELTSAVRPAPAEVRGQVDPGAGGSGVEGDEYEGVEQLFADPGEEEVEAVSGTDDQMLED